MVALLDDVREVGRRGGASVCHGVDGVEMQGTLLVDGKTSCMMSCELGRSFEGFVRYIGGVVL